MLDQISKDIRKLRDLMHKMSKQVDTLNNPMLVQVSTMLDEKLNQHYKLVNVRE